MNTESIIFLSFGKKGEIRKDGIILKSKSKLLLCCIMLLALLCTPFSIAAVDTTQTPLVDHAMAPNWTVDSWKQSNKTATITQGTEYVNITKETSATSMDYGYICSPTGFALPTGDFTLVTTARAGALEEVTNPVNEISVRIGSAKVIATVLLAYNGTVSDVTGNYSMQVTTTDWHEYVIIVHNTDGVYTFDLYIDQYLAWTGASLSADSGTSDLIKLGVGNGYAGNIDFQSVQLYDGVVAPEAPGVVESLIWKIQNLGTVSYKAKSTLDALEAQYAALSPKEQAQVTNYGDLQTAWEAYQAAVDAYNVTFTGSFQDLSETNQAKVSPWILNQTEDQMAETHAAMSDELIYEYSRGWCACPNNKVYALSAGFWTVAHQLETTGTTPNDNVGSPFGGTRYVTLIMVPYTGMAFTMDPCLFMKWYSNGSVTGQALTDPFTYQGKTYQVFYNNMKFYDTVAYRPGATVGTITSWGFCPGSVDGTILTTEFSTNYLKPVFSYMYARYNQDHKWEDKVLGVPSGNAAKLGDTYYHGFDSDDGKAYLLTSDAALAKISEDNTDSVTYQASLEAAAADSALLTGALADALKEDITVLETAGVLLSATEEAVYFENGILTADGFSLYSVDASEIGIHVQSASAVQHMDEANWNGAYDITWNVEFVDQLENAEGEKLFTSFNAQYEVLDHGVIVTAAEQDLEDYLTAVSAAGDNEETSALQDIPGKVYVQSFGSTAYSSFAYRRTNVAAGRDRYTAYYIVYQDRETGTVTTMVLSGTLGCKAE